MIANINAVFPVIIKSLTDSPFQFYLTGSRFFGGATRDSDWDFFTKYTPEVLGYLSAMGFEKDFDSSYDDPSVDAVYYGYCEHQGHRVKVDVQLVNDAYAKLEVQKALSTCWPSGLSHFDKETRKAIWKAALVTANVVAKA